MRADGCVSAAGFVLAGGRSTRMGSDKALLPMGGRTLLEHIAAEVEGAAGNVTIIADPALYSRFGWAVVADLRPGCGPLGGIVTALEVSNRSWNVIAACDMPAIDTEFLNHLLLTAAMAPKGCECLAPLGPSGPEPLCAVYHGSALAKLRAALDGNILKMRYVLESLETRYVPVPDLRRFRNINTPGDWRGHD